MSLRPLLPVVVALIAGCGYTTGSGLAARGVRTVAVRVVENRTFRQGLEVPLTDEIHRELVRSDLLPASAPRADAVLEVEIVDDQGRALVTGTRQDPVREGALGLVVEAELRDRRTGRRLVHRRIEERAEYRNPIGEGLESAERELARDLARKIVLALETAF